MTIQIDTREKAKAIRNIISEFEHTGTKYISSKLYVGDYMSLDNPRLIVDRKQNLLEVCNNVCQDHKRFTDELTRANEAGIYLIILVEHSNRIKSLEDVREWENPRLKTSPLAVSGERLYKIISAIELKYGVKFMFCDKAHTGKKIIDILGGDRVGG